MRRIVMASMLYYSLDESMMSDAEFDALCKQVAARWKDLEPLHRWQLGSPEEILTSGYHVRVTTAAEGGAISWLRHNSLYRPLNMRRDRFFSKKHRVHWLRAGDYQWTQ